SGTELPGTDKQSEPGDSTPATPTEGKLDSAPTSHRSSHEPVSASVAAAALAPFFGSTTGTFADQAQSDFLLFSQQPHQGHFSPSGGHHHHQGAIMYGSSSQFNGGLLMSAIGTPVTSSPSSTVAPSMASSYGFQ